MPINPYIAGDPVGNSAAFIGREDVLREVLKTLRNPAQNTITLFGQRRIGKTSMLQYLKTCLPTEGAYSTVYFDLQDKAAWPLPRLLAELARTIADSLGWPVPTLSSSNTEPFRLWMRQRLDGFEDGAALVLLFDEFDVLADPQTGSAAAEFFPYLRKLLSLDPLRLQFVFVLGRNITDMSSVALSVFKGAPSKRVSLLNQVETFKLARLSEQNNTLFWPEKALETVWDLTHGHAYLTQALCSQVWEAAYDESPGQPPKVNPQMVEDAVDPALDASRNMLEWLWNGLGPAEKVVSAALAGAGRTVVDEARLGHILQESGVRILIRELQNAPQMLADWDILEPAEDGYVFRVELLRRWLAKYHPLSRTQTELDRIQPAADSLFQAADAFYGQGDLARAEDLLEQAVAINPNHLRANEMLSEILIGSGKLEAARDKLEKLIEFAPAVARPRLVQVYLAQAGAAPDDKTRLTLFEKVLILDPSQPGARAGLERIQQAERQDKEMAFNFMEGRQALQRGEWQKAVELLKKVTSIRPGFSDQTHKDSETAADLLARAVREDKQPPQRWKVWLRNNLALALLGAAFSLTLLVFSFSFGGTAFQAAVDGRVGVFGTLAPTFTPTFTPAPDSTSSPRAVDGMRMVYIPAGTFQMGSENGGGDESPVHTVTLDAFWMDQHEVTNAMYKLCVDAGACKPPSNSNDYNNNPNYPVAYVDWNKAKAYCEWTGGRLATEAEWEYAARGGLTGKTYPWGDEAPVCTPGASNGANYNSCAKKSAIVVKTFQPNAYGLYDMSGNVWEWVNDWYGDYPSGAVANPTGPESGKYRVLRGGSWVSSDNVLRVSYRGWYSPDLTDFSVGFRCVRSP
ncbi:MAG: SUMF1/EgtB/PvdO family nonheme iron enzyme [Anaerolineales bacterium]|jgi:formylglycine-generating enzyme required for sulfatase activity/tetratricopeptide (TPR) repeat protein|nr:SUMF1/EgtB/PvdO family nonheme iron enzyme [Anaerolineales bacterium]